MYQASDPLGHRGPVTCNNFILWSLDPSGGDTWVERKAVWELADGTTTWGEVGDLPGTGGTC